MFDKVRIAPSGHLRALHSLVAQYISICSKDDYRRIFQTEGATPYMDLSKKKTGFHKKEDIYFKENIWNNYFIQPEVGENEVWLLEVCSAFTDDSILLSYADRNEIKQYHDTAKQYLRYKPHILSKVESFKKEFFKGKVAGLHVRGSDSFYDKGRPHYPLAYFRDLIDEKLADYQTIFLATDGIEYVDYFKKLFGERVVAYNCKNRVDINRYRFSIHEIAIADPVSAGEEVLIEGLLLANTDLLIRGQSNITTCALIENPTMLFHQVDLPIIDNDFYHLYLEEKSRNMIYKDYYIPELEIKKQSFYIQKAIEFKEKQFQILDTGINEDEMKKLIKKYIFEEY
jgi:hypothetical protein